MVKLPSRTEFGAHWRPAQSRSPTRQRPITLFPPKTVPDSAWFGADLEVEEGQGGARIGEILTTLVYPLTEPQLTQEAGPDLRRTQQRMGLDVLLASPVPVGEGGIRTLSPHGVSCYDIPALAKILRQRCAYIAPEV